MSNDEGAGARAETRIKQFAQFFKRYMNVSSVVAAALPIPVTSFKLIATYDFQTKTLAVYTPLFCFLILAFIFYSRHSLGRFMFPKFEMAKAARRSIKQTLIAVLPLLLIVGSLAFIFIYHGLLNESILTTRTKYGLSPAVPDSQVLKEAQGTQTPEGTRLMIYYLGIFLTAEAAFVLMAIREHLQDLLELTEIGLIRGETENSTVTNDR